MRLRLGRKAPGPIQEITVDYSDLEFLGMNGTMLGCCGKSSPLAHQKSSDRYAKLCDYKKAYSPKNCREQIEEYEQEGLLTLFPTTVPAFPDAFALYVKKELLDTLGRGLDQASPLMTVEWQPTHDSDAWVGYVTAEQSTIIMDEWATVLLKQIQKLLAVDSKEVKIGNAKKAHDLTFMANCCAESTELRKQTLLYIGQSLLLLGKEDGLLNIYDYVVRHEFPDWKTFVKECRSLAR